MTFRIKTPGVFRCDGKGCSERIVGDLWELPEGWREIQVPIAGRENAVGHRCPKCKAKEPK